MGRGSKRVAQKEERVISFSFSPDRFGIRGGAQPLGIEYAKNAVRSLASWVHTVEHMFGDVTVAMNIATNAQILPEQPSWTATSESLKQLQDWLGAEYLQRTSVYRTVASGPEREVSSSTSDQIVDPKIQDAIEELRLYLYALQMWAGAFKAGVWVASVASVGSIEADSQVRLLQGLRTIAAVYEFDHTLRVEGILDEFCHILSDKRKEEDRPGIFHVLDEMGITYEAAQRAMQGVNASTSFADDPILLDQWLLDLRRESDSFPHRAGALLQESWALVERRYWEQWRWPPIGSVSRAQNTTGVSWLDLVYTTRYGCMPLLNWRGGTLSIYQWSRILTIAFQTRAMALGEPARSALGNLGFGDGATSFKSADREGRRSARQTMLPIAMISLYSESSPCWTWRPEPGVRAFALVPTNRAKIDEGASAFERTTVRLRPQQHRSNDKGDSS
jgi:hypothetical protein